MGCDRGDTVCVASRPDEAEANETWVALHQGGVESVQVLAATQQRKTSWEVRVARHDEPRARALLHRYGLPRAARDVFGPAGEGGGWMSSRAQQAAQLTRAAEEKLARMMELPDGVTRVEVMIAPPREDGLGKPVEGRTTATVVIKHLPRPPGASGRGAAASGLGEEGEAVHEGGASPMDRRVVCELVARCVPGLRPEDVAVHFVESQGWPRIEESELPRAPVKQAGNAATWRGLPGIVWALTGAVALLGGGVVMLLLRLARLRGVNGGMTPELTQG